MVNRIIALIVKELIQAVRDPKTRISLLAPPLIQLLIFTFAATLDVKNVHIAVLNRDNGKQSIELIQRFRGSPTFSRVITLSAIEEIAPVIDRQKAVMVLSIDENFSRKIESGESAVVELILDGRKSNTTQIVAGYANTIIQNYNSELEAKLLFKPQKSALFPYNWFNPNLLYYWYNIPSLVATLSMLTCLVVTSNSVAREKELGTFDQLLVSPLTPFEIVAGKIIPGVIVGCFEGLLLLTCGVFLFKVPFVGSFILFLISLLVFITAMGGVGLFLSSVSATQQQAMLATFIVMVPSVLLSGFATPVENMPVWLQPVSYIIPLKYMLVVSKGIFLKNIRPLIVLQNLWPLALIATLNLVGSALSFRRRLG